MWEVIWTLCVFKLNPPFLAHVWMMLWTVAKAGTVRYRMETASSPTISLLWHCGLHSRCFLHVRETKKEVDFNTVTWTCVLDVFPDSTAAQILFPMSLRCVSFWGSLTLGIDFHRRGRCLRRQLEHSQHRIQTHRRTWLALANFSSADISLLKDASETQGWP